MKNWLSGIRGTVLMILTWIVGWGLGFGGLIEAFVDPHGEIGDVWPTLMAIPGFISGVVFSALLRIAEGRRSFDEVSLARFITWGVVAGLVLGVLAVTGVVSYPRLLSPAALIGITTALSAVAAIGSAVFFRLVARRQTPASAGRTG
jgi:hypothetical protein